MHTTLTYMAAQQHVEDLRRAAYRHRLGRAVTNTSHQPRASIVRPRAAARREWAQSLRRLSIASPSRR